MSKLERIQKVIEARLETLWSLHDMYEQDKNEDRAHELMQEICAVDNVLCMFKSDKFLVDMEEIYFS